MKPWIVIITHSKWRDLPGNVYLKLLLKQKLGIRVDLIPSHINKVFYFDWLLTNKPDVVIFPKIVDPPRFIDYLKNKNVDYKPLLFVIPTEGYFGTDEEEVAAIIAKKIKHVSFGGFYSLNIINGFFGWNQKEAKILGDISDINKENIYITGQPRFDLYSLPSIAESRRGLFKRYGIPSNWSGKVITVTFSFPFARFYGRLDGNEFLAIKKFYEEVGEVYLPDGYNLEDYVNYSNENRKQFINMIEAITNKFSNIWVIAKTHPEEDAKYYEHLKGKKRVTVIGKDYIFNVLSISDLLIHHKCTTMLEAWICGIPTINYMPDSFGRIFRKQMDQGNFNTLNVDQVLTLINKLLNGQLYQERNKLIEDQKRILEECLDYEKGKYSGLEILKYMKINLKNINSFKPFKLRIKRVLSILSHNIRNMKNVISTIKVTIINNTFLGPLLLKLRSRPVGDFEASGKYITKYNELERMLLEKKMKKVVKKIKIY